MIPKWLYNKSIAILDIETDRIPTSLIHMIGVGILSIDDTGGTTYIPSKAYTTCYTPYSNGSLVEAMELVYTCDYWCGFNSEGFDGPEITKYLGIPLTLPSLDVMILAKIMLSKDQLFTIDAQLDLPKELWGSYSLKAFGLRLGGTGKLDFTDFDNMSEEMAIYMNQDVDLTKDLLVHLFNQENFPLEAVVIVEHKAAAIIELQTAAGFYLDIEKTKALNTKLLTEKLELATKLAKIFSPKWLKQGKVQTYKKRSVVRKYLPNTHYTPLVGTKL